MKIVKHIGVAIFSLIGMFVAISFVSSAYAETPVTSGVGGTLYHGADWSGYTMGFRFKPNVDGQITALRAYSSCSGSARTVKLYTDGGSLLASASITQNGAWAQASITPVNLTAGTYYRIGVYPSSCASYYSPPSPTFPATIGNITIDTGAYSSGDTYPITWTETNLLRGIPDFDFTTGGGGNNYDVTYTFPDYATANNGSWTYTTSAATNGLQNEAGAARYWTWDDDTTPSSNVGPVGGQGGNPEGYVFTEATSPTALNDVFTMQLTNGVNGSAYSLNVSFYISADNNGDGVIIKADAWNGSSWNNLLTRGGDTVATWTNYNYNLSSYTNTDVKIRFTVQPTSGTAWYNDIGFDTVRIYGNTRNTAPTITSCCSVNYNGYTRTGPSNTPWTLTTSAINDLEQTGSNQLNLKLYTGPNRSGTLIASTTCTSGNSCAISPAYNAPGLANGDRTTYITADDGNLVSSEWQINAPKVDSTISSPTSISHTPNPVTANNQYTVTFTASDTYSTGANEMLYQVRTLAAGGGTLVGSGNFTQGAGRTTSTLTDSTLGEGPNNRYLRIRDGANNWAETLFTVTKTTSPSVTTDAASSVTQTTATLNGTGNPNGYASTGWFRYYTTDPVTCADSGGTRAPASSGSALGSGSTGVAYSQGITGLTPGTPYWSCAIASNVNGPGVGSPIQFTTAVGTPTTVTTSTGESGLGSFYVTLNGSANPNNYASYGFFRLYTTDPVSCTDSGGTRIPALQGSDINLGSGNTSQGFSYSASGSGEGLAPSDDYWYCAFARNAYGTVASSGSDTFSTPDGAVSACDPPTSGNHTISTSCSYTGSIGGVDAGTGTNNTATLIIGSTKSLTMNPAQQVAWGSISMQSGASINLGSGSSLRRSPVWVVDADADGKIGSTEQYIGAQPAGGVRRNTVSNTYAYFSKILSATSGENAPYPLDCNDNSPYAYRTVANLVKDADQDGYKTATAAAPQCVGDASTINGRTYYKDASNVSSWLPDAQKLSATADCLDSDNSKWQLLTGYTASGSSDADGDGFPVFGTAQQVCSGSSLPGGYTSQQPATIGNTAFSTSGQGQLPVAMSRPNIVIANINGTNYIYLIKQIGTDFGDNTVYRATIDASGNIGAWSTSGQSQLSAYNNDTVKIIYAKVGSNNYLYALLYNGNNGQRAIYRAIINSSTGNIGAWSTTNQTSPSNSHQLSYVTAKVAGNFNVYGFKNAPQQNPTSYASPISGGNLSSWSTTLNPSNYGAYGYSAFTSMIINGNNYVYTVGSGTPPNGEGPTTSRMLPINSSGIVGSHSSSSTLPIYLANGSAVGTWINGYPYLIAGTGQSCGGSCGVPKTNQIIYTRLSTTGQMEGWQSFTNTLPLNLDNATLAAATIGNKQYLYVIGGQGAWDEGGTYSTVYKSTLLGFDCNDGDNTKWTLGFADSDGDNWANTSSGTCIGSTAGYTVNPQAYSDCNDGDGLKQANFNVYAVDNDNDGYGTGSASNQCVGFGTNPVEGGDCYDSNANAHPGQTLGFSTNRGDGSFDYDCDGSQTATAQLICNSYMDYAGCETAVAPVSCNSSTPYTCGVSNGGTCVFFYANNIRTFSDSTCTNEIGSRGGGISWACSSGPMPCK